MFVIDGKYNSEDGMSIGRSILGRCCRATSIISKVIVCSEGKIRTK
jgi:hypothetical protein